MREKAQKDLTVDIIKHFNPEGTVLDPSKGSGEYYENLPDTCDKKSCNEDEFFDYNEKVDWIITGFTADSSKFLSHAMEIADNIVYMNVIGRIYPYINREVWDQISSAGFGIHHFYSILTELPYQNQKNVNCIYLKRNQPPIGSCDFQNQEWYDNYEYYIHTDNIDNFSLKEWDPRTYFGKIG